GRHLPLRDFQVYVSAEGVTELPQAPAYVPGGASLATLRNLSTSELRMLAAHVDIEVFLAGYAQRARADLTPLLVKALPLAPAHGDRVHYATLHVPTATVTANAPRLSAGDPEAATAAIAAARRALDAKIERVTEDKDALRSDVLHLKDQLEAQEHRIANLRH